MRGLVDLARSLQLTMAWLEAVKDPPLDLGSRYFVERAARRLVDEDAEVTVVSGTDSSYATYTNPYMPTIENWGDAVTIKDDAAIVVFVPRREERSGLLHPLIVHELGHSAVEIHGLRDAALEKASKRKRLQRRFAEAVGEHAEQTGESSPEAVAVLGERLGGWIVEAICDAVAAEYLGPTYLYSFLAEVVAGNLDEPGRLHPPPRHRVGWLVEQLDENGWGPVMSMTEPLDTWIRGLASDGPEYRGDEAFLVWSLQTVAKDLRRLAGRHVRANTFRPDTVELDYVLNCLEGGVPPAQRPAGEAVRQRSILLGSWMKALNREGGGPSRLSWAADADELSMLLPKALEMSALVTAWSEP